MPPVPTIAKADPVTFAIEHLAGDADLTGLLGGSGRISPYNKPPYPRVVVSDPPGGFLRQGLWLVSTAVQWECLDAINNPIGRKALKNIYWAVIAAMRGLPEATRVSTDPVITDVRLDGGGWSPIPGPQPRYVLTTVISSHPPKP